MLYVPIPSSQVTFSTDYTNITKNINSSLTNWYPSMVGPSLQKHEKDLQTLNTHMEELKSMAKKQNDDNKAQISSLVAQMAEADSQIFNLSSVLQVTSLQAKAEREEMTNQLRSLMEAVKVHSAMLHPSLKNQVPINNESCASNVCYTSAIVTPITHNTIRFGENAFTNSGPELTSPLLTPKPLHNLKKTNDANTIPPPFIAKPTHDVISTLLIPKILSPPQGFVH